METKVKYLRTDNGLEFVLEKFNEIDSGSSCILIGGWVDCCQANNHLTKGKSIKVGIFENKSNELFFRLLILYVPSLWCVISFKRILIIIVMVVFEIHLVIFFFSIVEIVARNDRSRPYY